MPQTAKRRRCFFDVTIDGELAGRIVFELYDDIVPITTENFLQLCIGQAGLGKTTSKPLTYKGTPLHRIVKNFMIQGGDMSAGNGTGGESIYGGVFEDENFSVKHDQPFILSMANRGANTNGSQFFITTNVANHLDDAHVAFGRVISGQDVVTRIEQLKVGPKNKPVCDVIVSACGQLIKKKSEIDDEEEEIVPKQKKKKHHKRSDSEGSEEKKSVDKENSPTKNDHFSTIKAEDLPQVPETHNFLLRRSSPKKSELDRNDNKVGSDRRRDHRSRSPQNRRPKVKGRGRLLYRSESREGSTTPPHWKRESERLIPMDKLKQLQEKQKKLAEQKVEEAVIREKEQTLKETFGYRDQPSFDSRDERRHLDQRPEKRSDYRNDNQAPRRSDYRSDNQVPRRSDYRNENPPRHNDFEDKRRGVRNEEVRLHYEKDESSSHRRDVREEPGRDSGRVHDKYREERNNGRSHDKYREERDNGKGRDKYREERPPRQDEYDHYKQRRTRRPSDIEREKYRRGELDRDNFASSPPAPKYEEKRPIYPTKPTNTYASAVYPAQPQSYYQPPTIEQQQEFLAQQNASYQNGGKQAYVTDPLALAAMAAAYAKNANPGYAPKVPAGHYSTLPSADKGSKKADLPDSYLIEHETVVQPLQDSWDKDHGKRTKRVHEVFENERVVIPPRSDPTAKPRRSADRDKRRDSPSAKHRRVDGGKGDHRRTPERRDDRRHRSRSNEKRRPQESSKRRRSSTSSSSSSSSSSNSSRSSSSSPDRRRRDSRDRNYRRR